MIDDVIRNLRSELSNAFRQAPLTYPWEESTFEEEQGDQVEEEQVEQVSPDTQGRFPQAGLTSEDLAGGMIKDGVRDPVVLNPDGRMKSASVGEALRRWPSIDHSITERKIGGSTSEKRA
jgi:hypothetical protein